MIKLSSLIKEASTDHSNDRDMVVGVAEIIKMVKDLDNRKDIMVSMMAKFRNEDVMFDKDEFKKMCGL
jgi:NAD(P)H-flavin reductase